MSYFLELSVNGAVAGSLYALAALSFVVVYKATRVMNFALGEFVMFATGLVAAGVNAMGLALVPALVFGGAGMFAVAAGFNRLVLRHLIGRPVIGVIMVTIGFGAVLRAVAAFLFSGVSRDVDLPLPRGTVEAGGVLLSAHELAAAGIALALVGAVSWFFARTRQGIALRCVADDDQAALAMGIDVRAAFTLVWGLAGVVAVSAFGAAASLASTVFPAQSFLDGVRSDFARGAHYLIRLRVWHPVAALALGGYLVWLRRRLRDTHAAGTPAPFRWAAAVFVAALAVGVLDALLLAPVTLQMTHLFLAHALWLALVGLWLHLRSEPTAAEPGYG